MATSPLNVLCLSDESHLQVTVPSQIRQVYIRLVEGSAGMRGTPLGKSLGIVAPSNTFLADLEAGRTREPEGFSCSCRILARDL